MNQTNLVSIVLLAAVSLPLQSLAQTPNIPPASQYQPPMPHTYFSEFPTPEELARMTPPEPVTEDMIKKRFAKKRALIESMVARDRKQAEKYARDFARFQKHQSDQLAKIMARAEKEREAMLKRIDDREAKVLEKFREGSKKRSPEPQQY